MAKKTKRVFDPEIFVVTFGGQEYEVAPQPIARVIEFQQAIDDLMDGLSGFSTRYYVIDDTGNRIAGPFSEEDDALASKEENGGTVESEKPGVKDFLDAIVTSPYYAFKVVVPGLKEEDVKNSSFPELKNALDAVIEANGIGWLESFLKKTVSPMLPEIMRIIASSMKEALSDTTTTQAE